MKFAFTTSLWFVRSCRSVWAPALQTPPKFHARTPRERKKKENCGGGGKKKRAIFGPPTLQGSTLLGSTLLGSTFSGNIQKLAGGSAFLMSNVFGTPASDLDEILWWATVTLFGQSLGTSKQFDGPGWLHHYAFGRSVCPIGCRGLTRSP